MDGSKIEEISLEFMWVGHASILMKKGGVMVLIDPFFSLGFYWDGNYKIYQGNSPFIGTKEKKAKFIEQYASQIYAWSKSAQVPLGREQVWPFLVGWHLL